MTFTECRKHQETLDGQMMNAATRRDEQNDHQHDEQRWFSAKLTTRLIMEI